MTKKKFDAIAKEVSLNNDKARKQIEALAKNTNSYAAIIMQQLFFGNVIQRRKRE